MRKKAPEHKPRRIWAGILIIVAAAAAGLGGYTAISRFQNSPTAIVVDGAPVISVESRSAAKKALAEARLGGATGIPASSLRFVQPVTIRPTAGNVPLADISEAVSAIRQATRVQAEMFAIANDGIPVAALRNEKDARKTLDLVKAYYERGRTLCGASTFKGNVFISRQFVDTSKFFSSPEKARDALVSVVAPAVTHSVVEGDRATNIAEQYRISLDDLENTNPGKDLDRLEPGDLLIIRRAQYPITILSKAMVSTTVRITPPREAGSRTGKRTVRMMVTYENGVPIAQDVISQLTTWERAHIRRSRRPRKTHTHQPAAAKTETPTPTPPPAPSPAPETNPN